MTATRRYRDMEARESDDIRPAGCGTSTTVVSRTSEQAPLPSAHPQRREDLRNLLIRKQNARVANLVQKVQASGGVTKPVRKERHMNERYSEKAVAASPPRCAGLVLGTDPFSSSLRDELLAALPPAASSGRRRSRSRSRSRRRRRRHRRGSRGGHRRRDALKGQPELCKEHQSADCSSDEDIARPERMSMPTPDE